MRCVAQLIVVATALAANAAVGARFGGLFKDRHCSHFWQYTFAGSIYDVWNNEYLRGEEPEPLAPFFAIFGPRGQKLRKRRAFPFFISVGDALAVHIARLHRGAKVPVHQPFPPTKDNVVLWVNDKITPLDVQVTGELAAVGELLRFEWEVKGRAWTESSADKTKVRMRRCDLQEYEHEFLAPVDMLLKDALHFHFAAEIGRGCYNRKAFEALFQGKVDVFKATLTKKFARRSPSEASPLLPTSDLLEHLSGSSELRFCWSPSPQAALPLGSFLPARVSVPSGGVDDGLGRGVDDEEQGSSDATFHDAQAQVSQEDDSQTLRKVEISRDGDRPGAGVSAGATGDGSAGSTQPSSGDRVAAEASARQEGTNVKVVPHINADVRVISAGDTDLSSSTS